MLGFVLLFTDLTERKLAETARTRFQEGVFERQGLLLLQTDARANRLYHTLMSPILENAQLAALEITDGVDVSGMAENLEGVRASLRRSAEVLEYLAWYAVSAADLDLQ